ncbi:MAG TPA: sulfide/dihydroorotate dehydrogenase-like FAD/NAD-binding protein [Candidatus Avimonas sp.]|jgi:ferredoxin--NADP+ reductase|nr:sulfide/dihydroorotate dehydrogenase-like FAD/NAD-binding protein [Clostridiales bacterium]HOB35938.1 sulfide/dihydroorotate dehydrogenase-like FAD/NAD-binding protein [Candidatus Avimonas sp.]HQA15330.1 sulfide/dihydroorotate dehydrogenase-like FAD/NAD-binding protein [Candidatus Avimonas sp.]HQD37290.1 sulfide/dihydroorotate dehydrogenase-like FAD/NAD-binding protein [Candidatus Avimonas sp.]
MYRVLRKRVLNPSVTWMDVEAPLVARKAKAGQFVILRVNETGERIPLTIADYDREKGSVTIIFQKVGGTTRLLDTLEEGDYILDFAGPLGRPTEIEGVGKVAVVGGGVGCAIAYPAAKAFYNSGAWVDMISGFRSRDLIILEDEMAAVSRRLFVMTDDGSNGSKGFVTDKLKELLEQGESYDLVFAVGPVPMMRAVSELTRQYGVKTVVSMNPIMIDGTGMCGGCRVTVGGEVKFACVDGPEFDGHKIDWDEAVKRLSQYRREEQNCRLFGQI